MLERDQLQERGPHRLHWGEYKIQRFCKDKISKVRKFASRAGRIHGGELDNETEDVEEGLSLGITEASRGQRSPRSSSRVPSPALLLARGMSFRRRDHPARLNVSQSSL